MIYCKCTVNNLFLYQQYKIRFIRNINFWFLKRDKSRVEKMARQVVRNKFVGPMKLVKKLKPLKNAVHCRFTKARTGILIELTVETDDYS